MKHNNNNFSASIENDILKKQNQQKENTIIDLENKIKRFKIKIEEYKGVISQKNDSESVDLSEIKLYQNIREINPDDLSFKDLVASIKEHGQLQPVLLTLDNYLIAGERRYKALKQLGKNKILTSKIDKNLEEIIETLSLLQYSENEVRKNLDNFEIGDIFNSYSEKGYKNIQIAEIFGKHVSNVAALLQLKDIDQKLKNYVKQFQIYGYSTRKYSQLREQNLLDKDRFYKNNANKFIGYKPLAKIALKKEIEEQKQIFLKLFSERLSDEELNSEFFKNAYEKIKTAKLEVNIIEKAKVNTQSIIKMLEANASESFKESDKYKKILKLISSLEKELEEE